MLFPIATKAFMRLLFAHHVIAVSVMSKYIPVEFMKKYIAMPGNSSLLSCVKLRRSHIFVPAHVFLPVQKLRR